MEEEKKKIEQEKTAKSRKIIVRIGTIVLLSGFLAGVGTAIYKLQTGQKLGNTRFSIEKSVEDDTIKMKIR